ncbi:polysaccharide lyase beta-sandwich domain-containing protein [Streptomyces sp. HNM0645]|uniref:polysaccharide lyase beta-sandwich domain-containing protein n=1 Tax=Streptomyces sp. HNM0645 TaxID=2782343 RepID=UPI0024B8313D|nr:polysaccharide lyase beta-sandwich domain-containing protein [Streptomyces sp. HNM0645]MDI9885227.1 polysaccharide lyase beta-sandwich domain-containing protein [Streptomyces sp. HNM0645]
MPTADRTTSLRPREAPSPVPPVWSIRALLLASTSGALSLALPTPESASGNPAGAGDRADAAYAALRRRWLDLQLGTGYDPAAEPDAPRLAGTGRLARTLRDSMAPAGDSSLFPGRRFDPPSGITASYRGLWTMTQAFLQPGTGWTGDTTMLAGVVPGPDHLSERIHNPSTTRYGNRWEWRIGSPRLLTDTVTALHDELTDERRHAACAAVDHRNRGERPAAPLTTGRDGRWAHLGGHGGWVLLPDGPAGVDRTERPGGSGLRTLREARTGAWRDINTTSTPERRSRHYQTVWLDHGTDPVNSSYGYILMPGASRREVADSAADRAWLEILDNSDICQSVAVCSLGLTAANFWRAAAVGALTVTSPASVVVRRRGRTATLHISEPMRSGQPLELVWDCPVGRVLCAAPSVEVLDTGRRLRLRVTPGTAGAVHGCEVATS